MEDVLDGALGDLRKRALAKISDASAELYILRDIVARRDPASWRTHTFLKERKLLCTTELSVIDGRLILLNLRVIETGNCSTQEAGSKEEGGEQRDRPAGFGDYEPTS